MGLGSLWHWVMILLVVLVLFGRGRIAEIMGDFGSGIKNFKRGMDEETPAAGTPKISERDVAVKACESETTHGHM